MCTDATDNLKHPIFFDFRLCGADVFFANASVAFPFSQFTGNTDKVNRLPCVTMSLSRKCRRKRDHIIVEHIIMKSILTASKDRLELVCVVVVKVDVFRSKRTNGATPDRFHHLRVV
ncbi:hypothetical protein C464_02675 [Halorubrum coriense DSM 10284]|uniref:Uncharacterized protein n=1 Tax=Halorubrum coriense DSM 10284 TaxID=1227466 RepID=M0EVM4_9EURY|nr:hypothetical protein C464_02675 [Halorubrum coriense DSM 10284]